MQSCTTDRRNDDVDHATRSRTLAEPRVNVSRFKRYGPSANASTGAELKHSSASRGSSTIGRPAVLSDVLTTDGNAGQTLDMVEHARNERFVPAVDGLHSSGSVDMNDRGEFSVQSGTTRCVKSIYGLGTVRRKAAARVRVTSSAQPGETVRGL